MRTSIAMATYNGAKYLQAQLNSFLAQTRLPDELIITDDRSTDETLDIIRQFAESAPFPVVWSQNEQNLGYGGNFNAALQKTTGDLVFLSDQDDVWFPEKIERMVAFAESEPKALVLMNDAELTDAALCSTGLTKLGQIRSAGFSEMNFVMGCCAVVRRDLLDLILPIQPEIRGHDNWIVSIGDGLRRKRVIPEVLQYYRRHGDNESQCIVNRTKRVTAWSIFCEVLSEKMRRLNQSSVYDKSVQISSKSLYEYILEWVPEAADHAPSWLKQDFNRFYEELIILVKVMRTREYIRTLPLSKRAIKAISLWQDGGYRYFSGVKSACRDVFMW